ncbi:hypothetical protein E2562_007067, partial [Oryza meyeriana var. granulata]
NVPLLLRKDVLSNIVGQLSFPAAGSENFNYFWSHSTLNNRVPRGTGTYIPRMERILAEKGRSEREILTDRPSKIKTNPTGYLHQHNSPEVGCSGASNGGITVESTNCTPTKQKSLHQDYSSKSVVPAEGGFVQERAPMNRVTVTKISQPFNVHYNQHGYVGSDMNMVDNQKSGTGEGLVQPNNESRELPILHQSEVQISETSVSSPCIVLPHCVRDGQGNFQESDTCQPSPPATEVCHRIKTKQDESLQSASLGPISFSAPCAKFREAFHPLPDRKGSAEAPVSTMVSPWPAVVTES